jgi:hypothetical protein
MERLMPAVVGCLVACVVVLVILLTAQCVTTMRLRRRNLRLARRVRARDEEARHLVATRLPPLEDPVYHRPRRIPGLLHPELAGTEYAQNLDTAAVLFAKAGDRARTRADKSAQSALKAVMKTVQSLAKEQQLVINTMQSEHDTPEVLEALLEIDHANSQLSRRAQAIAVLCGSWAGQQRSPATLTDVVRGATSRIRNYLRVQVHEQVDTAVASWAVEPVVLALAELLDNAARYSPPTTTIEVNFQKAHHGIGVMVDDAGVGMDPDARQRAADTLSGGRRAVDITALGDPPQIGFAVVGVLAARYGFTVSVDTVSPYGGVRAVLFLPTELLTELPASETVPAGAAAVPDTSDADELSTQDSTPSGLPKRRPRPVAAPSPSQSASQSASPSAQEPATAERRSTQAAARSAAGLGAWQRGSRSGRATGPSDTEGERQA